MTTDYKAILRQVMEQHPDLSYEGWRVLRMLPDQFEQMRIALLDNLAEFQAAYEWCTRLEHRKSVAPFGGYSYSLKHVCEEAVGHYISNGTLIAAMLAHGFKFLPDSSRSPNCTFFVTRRSVKQAQK